MATRRRWISLVCCTLSLLTGFVVPGFGQTETAKISGRVTDPKDLVVVGAQVEVTNVDTNIIVRTQTNGEGIYVVPSLRPGRYMILVRKEGFATIVKTDLVLHVQDTVEQNFSLRIGSPAQSITVSGGTPLINTESATVSTVVDRQFVADLPLNGRSVQGLIELTPGVVLTKVSFGQGGQFSVNGQRSTSNYFTVDGAGVNLSAPLPGSLQQVGLTPGFGALGGTNNLVSTDAIQEFRIQTSTFAAEYGRMPGAQVSIVTRSGTNQFHGTLFEYFRNDKLDANDWFANSLRLKKAALRLNDFGGVLGGPIIKDRTFFFFSYEGFRLRLPQTGVSTVPSLAARQAAPASTKPFLNSFPIPNGLDLGNGQAGFNATFSDSSSLDATSIRVDQTFSPRLTVFGRYSNSPSDASQRSANGSFALNHVFDGSVKTQTLTLGATWALRPTITNDLRVNYSTNRNTSSQHPDTFGGAVVPPDSAFFPPDFPRPAKSVYRVFVTGGKQMSWSTGPNGNNLVRQVNLVDNFSLVKGSHALKFGADWRRLSPDFVHRSAIWLAAFPNVASFSAGRTSIAVSEADQDATVLSNNLGAFAQDTWKVTPHLTLSYGLRWELEPPPSTTSGPTLLAVAGFSDPSTMALAPPGTHLWATTYGNFAPRAGVAYQLSRAKGRETVLRGGFGIFYDLASGLIGNAVIDGAYPFGAGKTLKPGTIFPFSAADLQLPPITLTLPLGSLNAFDPHLDLPYTWQWNIALEQSLGSNQALSASYVAAAGRRLLQSQSFSSSPNPNFRFLTSVGNTATSDYHALQLQFKRRLSKGLEGLASYTWSHSIDTSSGIAFFDVGFVSGLTPGANRGNSDFDVRHSFSAALTYNIPAPRVNALARAVLRDWSMDTIIQARSALPVNVGTLTFTINGQSATVRPDVIPGVPFYLSDPAVPGGRRINPAAFSNPPVDPATGNALREGTLGRNVLRGFGATQWDFALHRQFNLTEKFNLQFRSEFFNLLNHPNFASPNATLGIPGFGTPSMMLGRSLSQGPGGGRGGFSPLFQLGGPRDIQFALRLQF
jgi:Carboxypeptidase regulatory-like domain/TonB dependent receptor/TonB-dependent Receptor Plug Domain